MSDLFFQSFNLYSEQAEFAYSIEALAAIHGGYKDITSPNYIQNKILLKSINFNKASVDTGFRDKVFSNGSALTSYKKSGEVVDVVLYGQDWYAAYLQKFYYHYRELIETGPIKFNVSFMTQDYIEGVDENGIPLVPEEGFETMDLSNAYISKMELKNILTNQVELSLTLESSNTWIRSLHSNSHDPNYIPPE